MKYEKKLALHIGLHKSGTTSIQFACSNNRHILKNNNIFYPEYEQLTLNSHQHLGFNANIYSSKFLIENTLYLKAEYVFISNEEISQQIANQDEKENNKFIDSLNDGFNDIIFIITIRDIKKLVQSAVFEYISGSSFPIGGIDDFIKTYLNNIIKLGLFLNNKNKIIINLDAISANDNWPQYFLYKAFNKFIGIENVHHNKSSIKTSKLLFSSIYRALYSNIHKKHFYSSIVNSELEKALAAIEIENEFDLKLMNDLNEHIIERVSHLVEKVESDINRIFYS